MPDTAPLLLPAPESPRPDRPALVAFATDAATEAVLREGLQEPLGHAPDLRRGSMKAAIAAMSRSATPRVLVVDVTGEDMPVTQLGALSEVVEPDVCVLVIGERADLNFYREITRGLGVAEYLAKPLTRDLVVRVFGPHVHGRVELAARELGGRLVTVTGACGGVGASVIAANLGWQLGVIDRHHTVLLDADLYLGTQSFLFDQPPGPGLRLALEAPERIDTLLAERTARPVDERLHVLAGQERLQQEIALVPGAGERLMAALRRRYNFIVADTPAAPSALVRELQRAASQRVVVLYPTLPAVRGALRLLGEAGGGAARATLVLNRLGMPGGLTRAQIEEALGLKADIVIPDLPRPVAQAVTMGTPLIGRSRKFAAGIRAIAGQVGAPAHAEAPGRRRRWWPFR
jgi:pilus assembly protein CpaE